VHSSGDSAVCRASRIAARTPGPWRDRVAVPVCPGDSPTAPRVRKRISCPRRTIACHLLIVCYANLFCVSAEDFIVLSMPHKKRITYAAVAAVVALLTVTAGLAQAADQEQTHIITNDSNFEVAYSVQFANGDSEFTTVPPQLTSSSPRVPFVTAWSGTRSIPAQSRPTIARITWTTSLPVRTSRPGSGWTALAAWHAKWTPTPDKRNDIQGPTGVFSADDPSDAV
jgi:hypothetical protein